jgi:hypothetical protein
MAWFTSILLASALAAVPQVEVHLTEGTSREGTLVSLTAETIVVESVESGSSEEIASTKVRQLQWKTSQTARSAVEPGAVRVLFGDGSQLAAQSYVAAQGQATIGWPGTQPLQFPTERIRAVRLAKYPDAIDKSWQELLTRPIVADIVGVLRKSNELDHVQGVLQDVTPEVVKFQFDGDSIDVKRTKVVGIAYYRPQSDPLPPERGTLVLRDGSQLKIETVSSNADGGLQVRTIGGNELQVPGPLLDHLDFTGQSLTYLSGLDPEASDFTPLLRVRALETAIERWYAPQRDKRLNGEPLQLRVKGREQSFDKGLALHSRSQLVYRTANQYRRFQCLAGLDPALGTGQAQLTILADGTLRFQQILAASADAVPVEVDLSGVNRLTVLVDYGDQSDIADHVILGDARLIK